MSPIIVSFMTVVRKTNPIILLNKIMESWPLILDC